MLPFSFRKIMPEEIDAVHTIYNEVFEWLKKKGVRQWLTPKPREYFEDFQGKGELYGLFLGSELAIFAALTKGKPPHWRDENDITNGLWGQRLTLNPRFRGQDIGKFMVLRLIAEARARGASHICLDAVDEKGVMPAYYENLGFKRRKSTIVTYPNGNKFPVVFLRCETRKSRNPRQPRTSRPWTWRA
jgi:GNAT superfamily N-acetyltransferase